MSSQENYPLEGTLGAPNEILKLLPQLLAELNQQPSRATYLTTPPGIGILTFLPMALVEHGWTPRVIVSDFFNALNLRNLLRPLLPNSVGLLSLEVQEVPSGSQVIYMTAEYVRRRLFELAQRPGEVSLQEELGNPLILGQADQGSPDQLAIYYLWRYLSQFPGSGTQPVRLILTGAPERSFYTGPLLNLRLSSPQYDVGVRYLPSKRRGKQENRVKQIFETLRLGLAESQPTEAVRRNPPPGYRKVRTLLVIARLPEARRVIEELRTHWPQFNGQVINGFRFSTEAMQLLLTSPKESVRLVVTTPQALPALFVPSIDVLVDTLQEDRWVTAENGGLKNQVESISKEEASIRSGLLGQTRSGLVYRLLTQGEYQRLPEKILPEYLRVPLFPLIIDVLRIGRLPEDVIQIPESQLLHPVDLIQLGLVSPEETPTSMGLFARDLRLAPRQSVLLYHWMEAGYPLFPGLVAATLIDRLDSRLFVYPPVNSTSGYLLEQMRKRHQDAYFTPYLGENDLETLLKIWLAMANETNSALPPARELKDWARVHSLEGESLIEVTNLLRHSIGVLQQKYSVEIGPFESRKLMQLILPILERVYQEVLRFDQIKRIYQLVGGRGRQTYFNFTTTFPRRWVANRVRLLSPTFSGSSSERLAKPQSSKDIRLGTLSRPRLAQIALPIRVPN